MKTNELRRGNLVKVDGKIYQVFSLDSCFVGLSEVGKDELIFDVDVSKLEPVELTEEWLLRFGFECEDNHLVEYYKSDEAIQMLVDNCKATHRYYGSSSDNYEVAITLNDNYEVLHVINIFLNEPTNHSNHLQNLFQSLTGQELEIKL